LLAAFRSVFLVLLLAVVVVDSTLEPLELEAVVVLVMEMWGLLVQTVLPLCPTLVLAVAVALTIALEVTEGQVS
jgi:hypothetical protein